MFLPRFMSKLLKSGLLQQILVPSTSTSNTSILTFYWFCILAKTYVCGQNVFQKYSPLTKSLILIIAFFYFFREVLLFSPVCASNNNFLGFIFCSSPSFIPIFFAKITNPTFRTCPSLTVIRQGWVQKGAILSKYYKTADN